MFVQKEQRNIIQKSSFKIIKFLIYTCDLLIIIKDCKSSNGYTVEQGFSIYFKHSTPFNKNKRFCTPY